MIVDVIKILTGVIITLSVIFGGIFLVCYALDSASCRQFAAVNPTREITYLFPAGCMVKMDDGMVIGASHIHYINSEVDLGE